ncbi:MAG: tRNA (N(6)-L-threonylcarbamoyladenosine(37)-C(2))-methylthiotransferase MtaB [Candidatus Humimicrobiaceae bacterium]
MIQNSKIHDGKNERIKLKRFSVFTFGCKTNQSESDVIIRELLSCGFELVQYGEKPDFMVINTCTVTSISDKKARQLIRRIKLLNPLAKIIVTGCFVNFNNEFLNKTGIDYIFSNEHKDEIAGFIKKESGYDNLCADKEARLQLTGRHTREFIKIQDGCEQKCSYCIVPYVRNKYKSQLPGKIIEGINLASGNGLEEIVITGIHIGKYGADFNSNDSVAIDNVKFSDLNLCSLLELLIKKTHIKRIRLSSIEINEITDELQLLIKNNDRLAKHLHIPLQSGSSKVLSDMRRPYDSSFFFEKIKKIKKLLPDAALTSDIIVGFPGETNADFNETLNAAVEINFSKIHVFKYSPRKFTPAALMDDQVKEEIKNERSLKLRELASELRKAYINSNNGKILKVAIEKINYSKGYASGMSENYIKVYFPLNEHSKELKIGNIVNAKADRAYLDGLQGFLI